MPKYEHPDWGDIQKYMFTKGIITAVYPKDDTADVTVPGYQDGSGVPIFYHCSDDAEERDNGAIKGAASAFSSGSDDDPEDGDEVRVMCDAQTGRPVRIIGFMGLLQSCCWESWDSSKTPNLCKNHDWLIRPYAPGSPPNEECPSLPWSYETNESLNINNGVLIGSANSDTSHVDSVQHHFYVSHWTDEPEIQATELVIKISTNYLGNAWGNCVAIFVYDEFDNEHGWVFSAPPESFYVDIWGWTRINDNNGEKQSIDLAGNGIVGKISGVDLLCASQAMSHIEGGDTGSAEFLCDYICFI